MEATIKFKDQTEMTVEKNGDCYILPSKPLFPADFSVVTIESDDGEKVYTNAYLIECASIDGRFWFAFGEESQDVIERKALEARLDEAEAALIELAGMIGGIE